MRITLIAAMDQNRVIGDGSGLPWHLPEDVAHFRSYCQGKPVLVGRRSYKEMIEWFLAVKATPLVLTRSQTLPGDPLLVPHAEKAKSICLNALPNCAELVIAGGGETFSTFLPQATHMVLTQIEGSFEGSATFPPFAPDDWLETSSRDYPADSSHSQAFKIRFLQRKADVS